MMVRYLIVFFNYCIMNFWLKVKKDYILENFNELLNYLRYYPYDAGNALENGDFKSTLDCMMELCYDLAAQFDSLPLDNEGLERPDVELTVRLLGATLLAASKCGMDCAPLIVKLATVLISEVKLTEVLDNALWKLLPGAMAGCRLQRAGFGWSDLVQKDFSISIFAHKFVNSTLGEIRVAKYFEKEGLLMLTDSGVSLTPTMNLAQRSRRNMAPLFDLGGHMVIDLPREEVEPVSDFADAYTTINQLGHMQPGVKPSPVRTIHSYVDGQNAFIRVTGVFKEASNRYRIEAVTIDPNYEKISGPVRIETPQRFRPSRENICAAIQPGNILCATIGIRKDSVRFDLSGTFEDFYRAYCKANLENLLVWAIYDCDYETGTQWITSDGARIGVDNSKMDALSEEDYDYIHTLSEEGKPVALRTYMQINHTRRPDAFYIYAQPELSVGDPGADDLFSREDADRCMAEEFMELARQRAEEILNATPQARPVSDAGIAAMGRLLWREVESFDLGTLQRLVRLGGAEMLMRLIGREDECEFLRLERRFLSRAVDFAQSKPVASLPEGVETRRSKLYGDVVRALQKYKNPTDPGVAVVSSSDGDISLPRIEALVDASNSIVGIVGAAELNNIKKAIAHALDVDDEYQSILSDRTYYGVENVSLEFKQSLVFPPLNRRRFTNTAADPDLQKWAILKAICAFLNSRTGGELILGVNDGGYAEGLDNDIRTLVGSGRISEANMDHYILYLQRIVDTAFTDFPGEAQPRDVTSLNVSYRGEVNPEGKQILHVQVQPYAYGAVKFVQTPPEGYAEAYVRRSGSSVPLTPELRVAVDQYKLATVNDKFSDMAILRSARDSRNIVRLKSYNSASGVADRDIEVYKLWEDRGFVYGYDVNIKRAGVFKQSRWQSIDILDKKWTVPRCPVDIELDPFGMSIDDATAREVEVLLTRYAAQLLGEEYPDAVIKPNTDRRTCNRYPRRLICRVSSPDGLLRFCRGLPDDTLLPPDLTFDNI